MTSIFMDSSALFAAVLAPTGAAREPLRMSITGEGTLVISQDVATETRRNLSSKALAALPLFER